MHKLTIKDMQSFAKKKGWKFLSDSYTNSGSKLRWMCDNGHKFESCWDNIKQGHGCPHCANCAKLTINKFWEIAKLKGGECLSDNYVNNHTKLDYICSKSHKHSITFTDWYNGGYRCPTCYAIKISGAGNYGWKGGISFEPYCEIWKDREYKQDIRDRDGNSCLNPYCDSKNPNDLTIHHIDYNKKNCGPENLITVCRGCNTRANTHRKWHKAWYQALMYRRYKYIY